MDTNSTHNSPAHIASDPVNDEISFSVRKEGVEEHMMVEDVPSSDDDGGHDHFSKNFSANPAIKAAYDATKLERKELADARVHIMEMQRYMEAKGLSMAAFEKEKMLKDGNFNPGLVNSVDIITGRDEFGLPILRHMNVDGAGTSSVNTIPEVNKNDAHDLFDKSPSYGYVKQGAPQVKTAQEGIKVNLGEHKSWKNVVEDSDGPSSGTKLEYFPPQLGAGNGIPIIKPPKEFLISSQKAWTSSLVGYFVGANLPFKLVEEEAKRLWLHLGFNKLYMVKRGFFVFKFNSEVDRNRILASGPWHFKRNQIILEQWYEGKKLEKSGFTKLPVWVKIYDIPYSYWSLKGLSHVASGIGKPLQLDPITNKLEPLPFAKVLVEAKADVPLPSMLSVTVINSDGISESLIQTKVEYFNKPPQCSVCKVFGHSPTKCPLNPKPQAPTHQPHFTHQPRPSSQSWVPKPILTAQIPGDTVNNAEPTASPPLQVSPSEPIIPDSPDNATPPIPSTGLISKLKQVDEIPKIRGILKKPVVSNSGTGNMPDLDPDGFQKVEGKKAKTKKGNSPKISPHRN